MIVTDGIDIDSNEIPMWGNIGGHAMADLTKEYIDMKDNRHKVEHWTLSADDRKSTEQIMEELLQALTKRRDRPASA